MPLTISPRAQKSVPAPRAKVRSVKRGVGKPADGGGPAGGEAEIDEQAAEKRHPKAQRVEPRKGHVPRPDHQRDQVIPDADQDWHAHEKDHGRAVHREELIERVGPEEIVARHKRAATASAMLRMPPTTR